MPRPVYSTQFYAFQGLSGTGASITVPAGHVYVVKQVTMYASPLLGQTAVFFQDDVSGAALFASRFNIDAGGWAGLFGTLVFEAGQGFHFQVNASLTDSADVSAHGYDLTNP
jgi:hypothetical protein